MKHYLHYCLMLVVGSLISSCLCPDAQLNKDYNLISREGSDALKAIRDQHGSIDHLNQLFKNTTHTNGLPYHYYIPEELEKETRYPLVMFLHGHTDLTIQTHQGFPKGIWTLPEVQKAHPHIVFIPRHQKKENNWDDPDYHALTMRALNDFITQHNANPNTPGIDRDRIYITGFSKGGAGTWYFIRQQPDFFAAAVPLAGARRGPNNIEDAMPLKGLPLWIFNGDKEEKSAMSRASFHALKQAGARNVRFHEYAHRGHVIDDFAYFTPGFFDWLFAQSR